MRKPLLALVSGPPGSGRPALAARLAAELGLPLVSRDSIRAGLVEAQSGWTVMPAAEIAGRSMRVFHDVVRALLGAGVTVVAEHPLRGEVAPADVEAFGDVGTVKLVRCRLETSRGRTPPPPEPRIRPLSSGGMIVERDEPRRGGRRPVPEPTRLGIPVIDVEPTPRGYRPPLADLIWFLRQDG